MISGTVCSAACCLSPVCPDPLDIIDHVLRVLCHVSGMSCGQSG